MSKQIFPTLTYTVPEAAECLKIKRRKLTKLIEDKKLEAKVIGKAGGIDGSGKIYRVLGQSILNYLSTDTTTAEKQEDIREI